MVHVNSEIRAIWIESYNYIRCAVAYIVSFIPSISIVG